MTASIDYAHPRSGRIFSVDALPDGGVVVTVPTTRTAARVAAHYAGSIARADLAGLILGPVLFPFLWPICLVLVKDTPRAVIRLTRDSMTFTATTNVSLGRILDHREWAREKILEIRRNRYDGGLYVRLAGDDALTLLSDQTEETIERIARPLADCLARFAASPVRQI